MKFKNLNSWIFFTCTIVLILINTFIKSKFISIPIYLVAILGIIYSMYNSNIKKKTKWILIGLYVLCLILHIFL